MNFYKYFLAWREMHHSGDELTVDVTYPMGFSNTTRIPYNALNSTAWIKIMGNFNDHYRLRFKTDNPGIRNPIAFLDAND